MTGTLWRVSIFHSQNHDSSTKMKESRGGKQQVILVGWWYEKLRPCHSPRDLLVFFRHCVRYLMESINFPFTKSRLVRKDTDTSRKKIAGNLGRVVVRNMQTIPLTSSPSGSRVSVGILQHLFSQSVFFYFFPKTSNEKVRGIWGSTICFFKKISSWIPMDLS